MASTLVLVAIPLSMMSLAAADLVPTAPGPGQTFNAGDNCTLEWDVDQGGTWTNVTIDLMSGSNTNMSFVTNVVGGLDGTDAALTPFNWTCPEVDPYSAIYFYQFTNNGQTANATWTTRFTIASPDGETVPPPNATQSDGQAIPWGTGSLIADDPSAASTPDVDDSPRSETTDANPDEDENDSDDDSDAIDDSDDSNCPCAPVDEADIEHSEQISTADLATLRRRKDDDGDVGGDAEDDKKHKGDKHGDDDNGDDDSGDNDEKSGDSDNSHASSAKGGKSTKTASEDKEKKSSSTSTTSHKSTSTPKTKSDSSETPNASSSSKSSHPASSSKAKSAPKETSSDDDAAASASGSLSTAALSLPTKKVIHSSSGGDSSATKSFEAASSSDTCGCSTEEGGIARLMGGGASKATLSFWLQLSIPLVIALLAMS